MFNLLKAYKKLQQNMFVVGGYGVASQLRWLISSMEIIALSAGSWILRKCQELCSNIVFS